MFEEDKQYIIEFGRHIFGDGTWYVDWFGYVSIG
jgi:hypothetical protein